MADSEVTHMLEGFRHLAGYLDAAAQAGVLADIRTAIAAAPLYVPAMPRTGREMSVRMTNCGAFGWLTDKTRGYRYEDKHPLTGKPWPPIPPRLLRIWRELADCPAPPEACLINYYGARARMGSHRDEDEREPSAPVISISLGDDAVFHIGGLKRGDPKHRITLKSGDVVVLGGTARFAYHGIDRILTGTSSLLGEGGRLNLTLRRVTPMM